jgi:hypothetical protein
VRYAWQRPLPEDLQVVKVDHQAAAGLPWCMMHLAPPGAAASSSAQVDRVQHMLLPGGAAAADTAGST